MAVRVVVGATALGNDVQEHLENLEALFERLKRDYAAPSRSATALCNNVQEHLENLRTLFEWLTWDYMQQPREVHLSLTKC